MSPSKRLKKAYPISTFTYAIVPKGSPKKDALSKFVQYAIGPGQRFGAALDFAPIPGSVKAAALRTAKSL